MKYAIVIEKGEHKYAAYVPDLPGCTTSAKSLDEACQNMREAITLYIDALRTENAPIPEPRTHVVELDVA